MSDSLPEEETSRRGKIIGYPAVTRTQGINGREKIKLERCLLRIDIDIKNKKYKMEVQLTASKGSSS